jgi:hypothetical protein
MVVVVSEVYRSLGSTPSSGFGWTVTAYIGGCPSWKTP